MNRSTIIELIKQDPEYDALAQANSVTEISAKLNAKVLRREDHTLRSRAQLEAELGIAAATVVIDALHRARRQRIEVDLADPTTRTDLDQIADVALRDRVKALGLKMFSIADQNGGDATPREVQEAIRLMNAQPLIDEAALRYANVVAGLESGEIRNTAQMIAKFREPLSG